MTSDFVKRAKYFIIYFFKFRFICVSRTAHRPRKIHTLLHYGTIIVQLFDGCVLCDFSYQECSLFKHTRFRRGTRRLREKNNCDDSKLID